MSEDTLSTLKIAVKKCENNPKNRKICYMYIKQLKARVDQIGTRI